MQDGPQAQSLFPVGWIHTHPAFDCFLSSVDIHNQYGYQVGCRSEQPSVSLSQLACVVAASDGVRSNCR